MYLQYVHITIHVFTVCTHNYTCIYSMYTLLYMYLQYVHITIHVFTVCTHNYTSSNLL